MKREIRIDLLNPKSIALLPPKPEGIEVTGLHGDPVNGPALNSIALYFIVTVPSGIAINLVSTWLYQRIINYRAECVRVNGHEPKDEADLRRIVSEQIEIGKND